MYESNSPPARSPAIKARTPKPKKATQIEQDGLRYKNKQAGSPFTNQAAGFGSTMSCFLCGTHRQATDLESKKLLGRSQRVCKGGCHKGQS